MRRVVITGLGIAAPTGNNIETAWQNALAGRTGIGAIKLFDPSNLSVRIAGEVQDLEAHAARVIEAKECNRATRFIKLAMVAGDEAVKDSGLRFETSRTERWGCSVGVGLGGLSDIEENTKILEGQGPRRVSPFFIPYTIPNMAAGMISKYYNLKGPNICPTTACASGTHGVGEAWLYITQGLADVMVAGGAESAISPLGITAFANMKALSTANDHPETASRPFDKDRDGFVMGEGAGILVLEEMQHAVNRGAKIYAEVVGYGMSGDAFHITAPAPEGEGAERCMRLALASGNIPAEEVDHINAHGTSTKLNDWYESLAIERVFDKSASDISICSTKGVTGHCLGAAGGIEAVYMAMSVSRSTVPPTANYKTPDPDCRLNYTVDGPRQRDIRYAMSNSFGFGGTNASIVFKKYNS